MRWQWRLPHQQQHVRFDSVSSGHCPASSRSNLHPVSSSSCSGISVLHHQWRLPAGSWGSVCSGAAGVHAAAAGRCAASISCASISIPAISACSGAAASAASVSEPLPVCVPDAAVLCAASLRCGGRLRLSARCAASLHSDASATGRLWRSECDVSLLRPAVMAALEVVTSRHRNGALLCVAEVRAQLSAASIRLGTRKYAPTDGIWAAWVAPYECSDGCLDYRHSSAWAYSPAMV